MTTPPTLRWYYIVMENDQKLSQVKSSRVELSRRAGSVVGTKLDSLVTVAESRTLDKLLDIMDNVSHPLHTVISNQRSLFSERLLLPKCRTNRLKNSFNNPASMDPADPGAITKALSAQGIIVGKHDSHKFRRWWTPFATYLTAWPGCRLNLVYSLLAQQAQKELHQALALPWLPDQLFQPHVSLSVPTPESYAGDLGSCSRFLFQCFIVFVQQPSSYSSDNAKIGFVVNLLRGKASDWATALWQANSPVLQSFDSFIAEMKKVFDHPVQGQEAVKRLLDLRQGSQSVAAYSVDFRILAAASGWDSLALKGIFYKGLAEKIKDELSLRDEPDSLDSLISLAIRIDNRLRERQRERGTLMPKLAQPASASPPLPLSLLPPHIHLRQ
ncbi:hypothetical protein L3Q82_024433 [Scortum barcoo]|uniref:Uncharacterized protein n=1 Tax=Scortum barcoo TaxID=214431 RepID=A0ACB8WQM8_9TELE|nr:hypothetical protein L3Q82_024433 [Scortum barcoo]